MFRLAPNKAKCLVDYGDLELDDGRKVFLSVGSIVCRFMILVFFCFFDFQMSENLIDLSSFLFVNHSITYLCINARSLFA